MKPFFFEFFGLIGFFISGLIFIVAGLRTGDYLAVSGSVVWTLACVLWLVPVLERRKSKVWIISDSFLKFSEIDKKGNPFLHYIKVIRGQLYFVKDERKHGELKGGVYFWIFHLVVYYARFYSLKNGNKFILT